MRLTLLTLAMLALSAPAHAQNFDILSKDTLTGEEIGRIQGDFGTCYVACKTELENCHRDVGRIQTVEALLGERGEKFVGCVVRFNACIQGCSRTLYNGYGVELR